MKMIIILLTLLSCSHQNKRSHPPADHVSLPTALEHIKMSYMKGCVDAFHEIKLPKSFEHCRDQAQKHRIEVEEIIEQDTE